MLKRWQQYWFQSASLFDLAVCRILIVGFQVIYIITLDRGLWRQMSALPDSLYWPLPVLHLLTLPLGWTYRPSLLVLEGVQWITVACGILALIGLRTNFSMVVFATGNILLQGYLYSFGDFHHPDALMMIALCVLALSPAGSALSVDSFSHRRQRSGINGKFELFKITDELSTFARWPLLLLQWMFALIYLSAASLKIANAGFTWLNGYTLQYYLLQDGLRWGSDIGVWLAGHHRLVSALSFMTILFEGSFFLALIFPILAWVYIPLGIGFHIGIYITMRAPFFQYIAIYAVFVPWLRIVKTVSHWVEYQNHNKTSG